MQPWNLSGIEVPAWAYLPVLYVVLVAVGLTAKGIFLWSLRRAADRSGARLTAILAQALNYPLLMAVMAVSYVVLTRWTPAGPQLAVLASPKLILKIVAIASSVLFVDIFGRGCIRTYADRAEILKTAGGLLQGLVRAMILVIGALMLLEAFNIPITPLIASIGLGSLAVALALQPTLESFFAGVQIVTDRPIRVGDVVKLESGEEGTVDKIGWRSTWILLLPNNMLIVPNKQLVNSRVINYDYPAKALVVNVEVGVHYGADLDKVERVTIEVAEEIQKRVPGAVADFKPLIRFHTLNRSSIDFSVILRAQEFAVGGLLKHEFIKSLQKRYAQEGIVIPFPVTAINLDQERAAAALPPRPPTA
jgi:small-conductance mechanosensitive channel